MDWCTKWIKPVRDMGDVCPAFSVEFSCEQKVERALLRVTAMGVYEAVLNGERVGEFILAPGWTVYEKRLQVQEYDVTAMVGPENGLEITVGKGWYRSPLAGWTWTKRKERIASMCPGVTAELVLNLADGSTQVIRTDENWKVAESPFVFQKFMMVKSMMLHLSLQTLKQ